MYRRLAAAGAVALIGIAAVGLSQQTSRRPRPSAGSAVAAAVAPAMPVPPTRVGIGLGAGDYWISEWRLNDLIQNSASLVRVDESGKWTPLDRDAVDGNGFPINFSRKDLLVVVLAQGAPRLRAGRYDCRVSPGWDVSPFGDATISGSAPRFRLIIPDATPKNGVALHLKPRADHARLSELSCLPEGQQARINQAFLSDVKPFAVLRFMDLMRTNDAPPRSWARRTTPASITQSRDEGMSVEDMVTIVNAAGADAWFNMPLDADPDYYRQFAIYVRDHLAPGHRAYVELSNEVWNDAFAQGKEAVRRGKAVYPNVSNSTAADYYYADRVRALMAIWSDVFRGQEKRIVRVLASQAAWEGRPDVPLAHKETWRSVDALATAPYFGTDGASIPVSGPERVNLLFQQGPTAVDTAIRQAKSGKKIALRYGLRYITYEGGPGYAGAWEATKADLLAVNRDPRMRELYLLYLRRWQAEVGDLLMVFLTVATPGQAGYWGHKDYTGQPVSETPKMAALYDFLHYRQDQPAK